MQIKNITQYTAKEIRKLAKPYNIRLTKVTGKGYRLKRQIYGDLKTYVEVIGRQKSESLNKTTMMMEPVTDIPNNKFIEIAKYVFHVDDLARFLIVNNGSNTNPSIDPTKQTGKSLWQTVTDRDRIVNHVNLDPKLKNKLNNMFTKRKDGEADTVKLLLKNPAILGYIAKLGLLLVRDNPTSNSARHSKYSKSEVGIKQFFEDIEGLTIPERDLVYNISCRKSVTVKEHIDSLYNTCLHSVGYRLVDIYVTWYLKIRDSTADMCPSFPLYTDFKECKYDTFMFGVYMYDETKDINLGFHVKLWKQNHYYKIFSYSDTGGFEYQTKRLSQAVISDMVNIDDVYELLNVISEARDQG